jgi:MFS family permease
MAAAMLTPNKFLALIFLAISYLGVAVIQPTAFAVCLDIAPQHGGAVAGAMNTAAQVGAFLSSISYGYLVTLTGSYDFALRPMVVMLAFSALLWLKIDPTEPLIAGGALGLRFASSPINPVGTQDLFRSVISLTSCHTRRLGVNVWAPCYGMSVWCRRLT